MHRRYDGRVFAFDHPTLTHTPRQNIEVLLAAMPDGLTLDVDIVCHSRGGLVSRVLSEKQGELAVAGRQVRVGKVVFVGTPNAGTRLADEACIGDYIDTATNLLDALPTNGVTDALGYVLTGVKLLATGLWSGLTGLQSMQPGGPFGAWLNAGDRGETTYFALTSDYTPTDARLAKLLANRLVDKVFQQARNDMVVPTDGVYEANGSGYFPITDQLVLGAMDGVAHTQFFQHGRSTAQIAAWLQG
jgi:pimeloyl-ACP methyl ester carboxylesterase